MIFCWCIAAVVLQIELWVPSCFFPISQTLSWIVPTDDLFHLLSAWLLRQVADMKDLALLQICLSLKNKVTKEESLYMISYISSWTHVHCICCSSIFTLEQFVFVPVHNNYIKLIQNVWCPTWVEFVGSLLCSESISLGTPLYPSHQKPKLIIWISFVLIWCKGILMLLQNN